MSRPRTPQPILNLFLVSNRRDLIASGCLVVLKPCCERRKPVVGGWSELPEEAARGIRAESVI
jgi:hypothetical protein